jgi:hypothetical protein
MLNSNAASSGIREPETRHADPSETAAVPMEDGHTDVGHTDALATRIIMQVRSDLAGHTAADILGELSQRLSESGISASPEELARVAVDLSRVDASAQ